MKQKETDMEFRQMVERMRPQADADGARVLRLRHRGRGGGAGDVAAGMGDR